MTKYTSEDNMHVIPKPVIIAVIFLMLVHFSISYWFGAEILGGIPHIPDSVVYYREGILLSQGKFVLENFIREPYEVFEMRGGYLINGTLVFHYNHFWPAMLALPIKFGFEDFANPFFSAISLLLIFLISTKLYDYRIGLIAALLYCISPFTIIMAGEFMNHTATQLLLLSSFYFLILFIQKQKPIFAVLIGACLAYAFGIRQLTAVAISIPLVTYFLIFHYKRVFTTKSLWFLAGAIPIFLLFILNNQIITGSTAHIAHPAYGAVGTQHLQMGMNAVEDTLGGFFPPILFYSFVPMLIVSLAFVPLIILRKKEDYLLIVLFVSLVGAHTLFHGSGIHGYGPRYFFEAFFVFYILIARTILWSWQSSKECGRVILIILFGYLLIQNIAGLHDVLPSYRNYNGIDSNLFDEISKLDLANSIVLIMNWNWQGMDVTAKLWDPNYEKSFFIRYKPDDTHSKVLMNNPERKAYIVAHDKIKPYDWNATTAD